MKQTLHLVPLHGATLLAQTRHEWNIGDTFRVLKSTTAFSRGELVSIADLKYLENHPDITFETLTVTEHLTEQASNCYASARVLEDMKADIDTSLPLF